MYPPTLLPLHLYISDKYLYYISFAPTLNSTPPELPCLNLLSAFAHFSRFHPLYPLLFIFLGLSAPPICNRFHILPTSFLSTPLVFCISYNPYCNIRHLDSPQSLSLSLCFALALTPALALALCSSVTPTTWLHGYLSRSRAWLYTSHL
jgi:hypothetical protein